MRFIQDLTYLANKLIQFKYTDSKDNYDNEECLQKVNLIKIKTFDCIKYITTLP